MGVRGSLSCHECRNCVGRKCSAAATGYMLPVGRSLLALIVAACGVARDLDVLFARFVPG